MAKSAHRFSAADVEEDLSYVWYEKRPKTSLVVENPAKDVGELIPNLKDLGPEMPQPLLPPTHPLLGLKISEERRKLASIDVVLEKIRAGGSKMNSDRDWAEIQNQKKQLQNLFLTAEKSINENRASMSRFFEIIKENIRHKKTLANEIKFTKEKIEEYRTVEEEFTCYVDKYHIFEKYLESVAGIGENWRNVRDVLNRYETLENTSVECARILESELEQAADLRKRMLTLVETESSRLKALSNKLILLEVERKDSRDRRVYWEHMMQRIKYTTLDKMQEAISLREGVNDLYRCMCVRLRVVPTIPVGDTQGQMSFIHKNILFYKEVVTIASACKNPPVDIDKKECKKLKPSKQVKIVTF